MQTLIKCGYVVYNISLKKVRFFSGTTLKTSMCLRIDYFIRQIKALLNVLLHLRIVNHRLHNLTAVLAVTPLVCMRKEGVNIHVPAVIKTGSASTLKRGLNQQRDLCPKCHAYIMLI